jgi:spore coat polysaccharide biosynthesis predicted glycosyltransferase SpsG
MAEEMLWADLAISGAGSTAWELACIGVPSALIVVAHNQRLIAEALDAEGAAVSLGWHEDLVPARIAAIILQLRNDPTRREHMTRSGRCLVDGNGSERVASALWEIACSRA